MMSTILQSDGGGGGIFTIVVLAIIVVGIAGAWKTFTKAGEPGWAAIVPIYNLYTMLKIGDNEWWWLLVMFVPIVNLYAYYRMFAGVSRAFGQGVGFALGLWFLGVIFFPLLGFGEYTYQGARSGGGKGGGAASVTG